ncbi:ARF GTPase-activating protein GIT1 isoform X1 [Lates japonicus]|uniref:ARF GTPase-activating protein GIT1 isoform X1 n=1 Tax=Lates japonicus TaxID=270547 RepID=A0AAD3R6A7_LATJO|nr:ARF GTPase-activating protein GIT1 isoform X1 [Lates japonicus]
MLKTEQVTKNIRSCSGAAQEFKHDSAYSGCRWSAVGGTLRAWGPPRLDYQLPNSAGHPVAYDSIAKAAKQLVTITTREKKQ